MKVFKWIKNQAIKGIYAVSCHLSDYNSFLSSKNKLCNQWDFFSGEYRKIVTSYKTLVLEEFVVQKIWEVLWFTYKYKEG